jgi:prepilin-type N-terminal cleavage/methylation domain-containing protein
MNKTSPTLAHGFTLIEMTVVLLIMTLLAGVAIRETNSLSFQVRYEQTRERLERIREAILGNPRQIINGQQAVSGFVADMGRLPVDLHELLEQNYCSDRTYSTQATCEAAGKVWKPQPDWQIDNATGLGFGWRGPYLNISGSAVDDDAFVDGWGSFAAGSTDHNYGWKLLSDIPEIGDLTVLSYGKDQSAGGNCSDSDYAGDCSVHILKRDYQTDISPGITVLVRGQRFSLDSHCSNALYTTRADCETNGGTWHGGCSESSLANSATCVDAGKIWNSCSITAFTTQTDCEANQGVWYGDGYGCSVATQLDKASCTGTWYSCSDKNQTTRAACEATIPASNWFGDGSSSESRLLCLNIYHRSNGTIVPLNSTSTLPIQEDGNQHTMVFSFPLNTTINIGQAIVALYYQRGSDGCKTTMPYPLDSKPVTLTVHPRTSLPAMNW